MARKRIPKRKKDWEDDTEEIVKTEPDLRRADKENDETVDLTDEEEVVAPLRYTAPMGRYLRLKARESVPSVKTDDYFPFLKLIPEIRDMIYECLLVSKATEPIQLDESGGEFTPGGIETAILRTNRAVYNEATKVLYNKNKFLVKYPVESREWGPDFRVDDPQAAYATSRMLRNGQSIDISHTGLIYKDIFYRLRNVEFHIDVFEKGALDEAGLFRHIGELYRVIQKLPETIGEYAPGGLGDLRGEGGKLTLVIHPTGFLGPRTMEKALLPLFVLPIIRAIRNGELKVVLKGPFPSHWVHSFVQQIGTTNVTVEEFAMFDARSLDPDGPEGLI